MSSNSRLGLTQPTVSSSVRKRALPKNLPKREGERDHQRQDDAAEPVVGIVLQAPPAALVGGASRAGATGLRLGGRAQLVRNWSVYGQIKTTARARMGHAVGDKLVFCHEALHLKNKLQKAGSTSKQVAEKWDSDSDSDQSDEEGFDYII